MFSANSDSDRASSVEDYQKTCAEFIEDISKDYMDWVDRYDLDDKESSSRKEHIRNIVQVTNEWIYKFCDTIKKVDIVMNDGINKMAESTAGYPFKFLVSVNNMQRYTFNPVGEVKLNVQAIPREGRLARIANYQKDRLLQIASCSPVEFAVSKESLKGADILDDYVVIDASGCQSNDLVSVTVIAEEVEQEHAFERRGFSTLILLK
jgi:hypothetical protein